MNCLIYDIGKTYKRAYVFSASWDILWSEKKKLSTILDEDGEICEDLAAIVIWTKEVQERLNKEGISVQAINFSAFGGALVHLDLNHKVISPIYSYFKNIPFEIKKRFEAQYPHIYQTAATPNLGMLNIGMQLYWLKHVKPHIYKQAAYSLPLAQYLSFVFSGKINQEISNIGAHSLLWNHDQAQYLEWPKAEDIKLINQEPKASSYCELTHSQSIGVGIQGGTAALLPYLKCFDEPFILISSGSWSITLNAFAHDPISLEELNHNCFYFASPSGKTIKTARIFSGSEHDRQVKHLSACFNKPLDYFKSVKLQPELIKKLRKNTSQTLPTAALEKGLVDSPFTDRTIQEFKSFDEAYHQLILDLVAQHNASIELVADRMPIKNIVLEGLFAKSEIFVALLKECCFNRKIYVSQLEQSSAWGAALAIEKNWNPEPFLEKIKPQFIFKTEA